MVQAQATIWHALSPTATTMRACMKSIFFGSAALCLCATALLGSAAHAEDSWEKLGSREVNFVADKDVVPVTANGLPGPSATAPQALRKLTRTSQADSPHCLSASVLASRADLKS